MRAELEGQEELRGAGIFPGQSQQACGAAAFYFADICVCVREGSDGFRAVKTKVVLSILFSANTHHHLHHHHPRVTWLAVTLGLTMLFTHQGKASI